MQVKNTAPERTLLSSGEAWSQVQHHLKSLVWTSTLRAVQRGEDTWTRPLCSGAWSPEACRAHGGRAHSCPELSKNHLTGLSLTSTSQEGTPGGCLAALRIPKSSQVPSRLSGGNLGPNSFSLPHL